MAAPTPNLAALLGASLLVLAGCADEAERGRDDEARDPIPADWSQRALPFGEPHDHADPLQHQNLSTPNFDVIGYDPLLSSYYDGKNAGGYLCGDAQETTDGRRLAAVESRGDVGFTVIDVTDAGAPRLVGEFVMRTTHVYDLAVVPDGRHVVLVTSEVRQDDLLPPLGVGAPQGFTGIEWRSACDPEPRPIAWLGPEDPLPRPMSILLVSIENPETPAIVDQHPLVGYGHSVYSTILDGRSWLLVTTTRPQYNELSVYEFYEIVDTPAGARLNLLGAYKPPASDAQLVGPRGHDAWMHKHPVLNQTVAYLVGGDRLTILDVSDSREPREMGRWTEGGVGREGYSGQLHSVFPLPGTWEGRHYTVIGPEFGGHPTQHPSGIVWVIDTTNPGDPFEVAAWTLPHEVEWTGTYMFSNHYFSVHNRTLFVSMYHGGIWAVDLSVVGSLPFALLPSVGVFMPANLPPEPAAEPVRWAPTVEEALAFDDGTLLTFDSNSGLYTFRFDALRPAPPPDPWRIDPVHAR